MASQEGKQEKMLNSIATGIRELQNVIRDCNTESVVQWCLFQKGSPNPTLQSPGKQLAFLLGLLLATDEPSDGRIFGRDDWDGVTMQLRKLFRVYIERYSPDREQFMNESAEDLKRRELAILAFADYFQKLVLATDEQIAEQIRTYLAPFDEQLTRDLGISASDALFIAEGILAKFETDLNSLTKQGTPATAEALLPAYRIRRDELTVQHGKIAERFWELFTVGRDEVTPLEYPTERSIVEFKPFIRISDDVAFGCRLKEMLLPILMIGESCLLSGAKKENCRKFRSTTLEDQAAFYFKQILGESIKVHRNLFESPDNQNEHDIVILHDDITLFVEVKSSPLDEPFRDPELAFTRLSRNFRSDTGIQKAYNQANRLMQSLQDNDIISLYDRFGREALQLPSSLRDKAFCICVTKDNHGPMATCLSFLLDKDPLHPYPWVIGILDLENIAEAWQYYSWGARQLKSFLSYREKLHVSVFGDDELDFVGAFI